MMHMGKAPMGRSLWRAVLLLLCSTAVTAFVPFNVTFPSSVTYRAAVMTNVLEQAKPLAYYDENYTSTEEPFAQFRGFQPDLLRALIKIAQELDNVTVTLELEEAPLFTYGLQFEYLATSCNITTFKDTPIPKEDCTRLDFTVGDFYAMPKRSIKAPLTPTLITTAAATLQYTQRRKRDITTLAEAQVLGEPVCLLENSWHDQSTLELYPRLKVERCFSHEECVRLLKQEDCALFIEDDLQLKYMVVQDADLKMAADAFNRQDIVWPMNHGLSDLKQQLLIRWILQAKVLGIVEHLYDHYFSVTYCPLGKAGVSCDRPCSPTHGSVDRKGVCVCESTKWTGDDCNTEVEHNRNLIPTSLKAICYVMASFNILVVALCAGWLYSHRRSPRVMVAQPLFLNLILLGCLISSSTIFALAQEDAGDGPVHACMAVPWLYSVGFCITFGALLAKIRRVWLLFMAAAHMERVTVSAQETFSIVGLVLLVDVTILIVWTALDPLEWQRTIVTADKYLQPLESEGYCSSEHEAAFLITIAVFHLCLLLSACYLCYVSRNLPTQFSEGRYVSIAMGCNLQIFVVGVPCLIIVGNHSPQTSFFLQSVMIFLNDLAVLGFVFGHLIREVTVEKLKRDRPSSRASLVNNAMKSFTNRQLESERGSSHSRGAKREAFTSNTVEWNSGGSLGVTVARPDTRQAPPIRSNSSSSSSSSTSGTSCTHCGGRHPSEECPRHPSTRISLINKAMQSFNTQPSESSGLSGSSHSKKAKRETFASNRVEWSGSNHRGNGPLGIAVAQPEMRPANHMTSSLEVIMSSSGSDSSSNAEEDFAMEEFALGEGTEAGVASDIGEKSVIVESETGKGIGGIIVEIDEESAIAVDKGTEAAVASDIGEKSETVESETGEAEAGIFMESDEESDIAVDKGTVAAIGSDTTSSMEQTVTYESENGEGDDDIVMEDEA